MAPSATSPFEKALRSARQISSAFLLKASPQQPILTADRASDQRSFSPDSDSSFPGLPRNIASSSLEPESDSNADILEATWARFP